MSELNQYDINNVKRLGGTIKYDTEGKASAYGLDGSYMSPSIVSTLATAAGPSKTNAMVSNALTSNIGNQFTYPGLAAGATNEAQNWANSMEGNLSSAMPYNKLDIEGNALNARIQDAIVEGNVNKSLNLGDGPRASVTPQDGGLGSYGFVQDETGALTQIDKPAFDAIDSQGSGGLSYGKNKLPGTDLSTKKGTDWGMEGYGGVALGAGQLGLGVMSYLENSKTADKQRALMDQQIANNKFALGSAKDFKAALAKNFNQGA